MINAKATGNTVRWTNGTSADVASGDVVVIGDRIGIAAGDIAADADGVLVVEGIFELPAAADETWDLGDQLYWDATAEELTETASGNTPAGFAAEDKDVTTDTVADCKINA